MCSGYIDVRDECAQDTLTSEMRGYVHRPPSNSRPTPALTASASFDPLQGNQTRFVFRLRFDYPSKGSISDFTERSCKSALRFRIIDFVIRKELLFSTVHTSSVTEKLRLVGLADIHE